MAAFVEFVEFVVFVVDNKEYSFESSNTILDVKKHIIKDKSLSCKYIDIEFCLERPMRILGKFNVEPGKVPRTFDRYKLEQFAFKDSITLSISEINDYDPDKPKIPLFSGGRGRGRGLSLPPVNSLDRAVSSFNHTDTQIDMKTEPTFNLSSNDDFPSLGS
jgi:hypothetical protein